MKKIIKKTAKKIIKKEKDGFVKKSELKELLREQTSTLLEAVSDVIDKKINNSSRQNQAYTELRFQEVLDVMKDDRRLHEERYQDTKREMRVLSMKSDVISRDISDLKESNEEILDDVKTIKHVLQQNVLVRLEELEMAG
jgi:hypothetical protein